MARFGPAGPLPLGGAGPEVLLEVRPAPTVRFPENFIKAKLENAPGLVWKGQVRTFFFLNLGPYGPLFDVFVPHLITNQYKHRYKDKDISTSSDGFFISAFS